jgi:signal transduction histidine kinase
MAPVTQRLRDQATYRRLAYVLSAMPLGLVWFVALVTTWSLCIGLAITPLVIPVLIVLGYMTRGFAAVESELARALLGVEAGPPVRQSAGRGFRNWLRGLFGGGFWRAQGYLLLRWLPGFPLAVVVLSLIAAAVGMIFAPAWVPFVHGGAHLGFWRPHTFVQSLAFVPVGLVLLPLTVLLGRAIGAGYAALASSLLGVEQEVTMEVGTERQPVHPRRALEAHAGVDLVVVLLLVLIWAVTSAGYFWPVWVALPLAAALAIHAWSVTLTENPALVDKFRGSRTLAMTVGVGVAIEAYLIGIWAVSGHGYFWPMWPLLAGLVIIGLLAAVTPLSSPGRAEMAERIETLETSRAGAVDLQESELRRIERDLHDGAQARLVALGMSLGMAEQKLAEDPERAGELLAEARAGAEHALRELRDLARGIHPPVLADRGLDAALASLVQATPMRVNLSVDVDRRAPAAVETAAYFVVAEALANAAKHARAEHVDIRVARVGDTLELSVRDDGVGEADPNGTGLLGMRRRVEALDGWLLVTSPRGGPTTIAAELPCAS